MDQLIKYRALAADLSSNELKIFCSKLIDNGYHELIIGGIFNKMHKQIKQNQDISTIQTINKTMEEIVQKRAQNNKENDNKSTPKPKPKPKAIATIKSLSSSIINEIGSYLWLNEIVKMERVNRRFFIALRKPYPALRNLKFNKSTWIKKYCEAQKLHKMPLDFQQFRSLTNLYVTINQIMKYKVNELGRLFNKIQLLHINPLSNLGTFDDILNSNICNFESIKWLRIIGNRHRVGRNIAFTGKSYLKMISMSKQLEYLGSFDLKCNDEIAQQIKRNINRKEIEKLSKLKTISCAITRLELYKPILDILRPQIRSLHIGDPNALINTECNSKYAGFTNLTEFCFVGSRFNTIIAINELIKSVKNLKKLSITFLPDDRQMNNMEEKHFKESMVTILSMKSLEIIKLAVLDMNTANVQILNLLETAIMNKDINSSIPMQIWIREINSLPPNILLSFIKTMKILVKDFCIVFVSKKSINLDISTKQKVIKFAGVVWRKVKNQYQMIIGTNDDLKLHCKLYSSNLNNCYVC